MRIHLLFLYCIVVQVRAQAPQFSQFYTNPLFQNPALAGDAGTTRLIANYRNQWMSVGTPFQTSAFSLDTYAEDAQVGLGIQALYDRRGGMLQSGHLAGQVSRLFYLDANNTFALHLVSKPLGFRTAGMETILPLWPNTLAVLTPLLKMA